MSTTTIQAIIIAIGDELINGHVAESNSAYLAQHLAERGIRTAAHWTVPDDRAAIVDVLARGADRADVVIVTGGLGPTPDDVTRDALAEALGVELTVDEASLADLQAFFDRLGKDLSDRNRIQAMLPAGCQGLHNTVGTAPGVLARLDGAMVFCLPGVPHEMRAMFEGQVIGHLPAGGEATVVRTVHLFGMPESEVGSALADLMQPGGDVRVGTTVSLGVISVRIISHGLTPQIAQQQADRVAKTVKGRLGQVVFGEDDQTLAGIVGQMLAERGQTIATAESCTGGMIGQLVTAESGSSVYYLGGVIAYANEVKSRDLAVAADLLEQHGAVSGPVAEAMAAGCRDRFGSDWAVSTTGIAGPTGGTAEKPVGLVYISVAGPGGVCASEHHFIGPRDVVRTRAARAAVNELRQAMLAD